MRWGTMHPIRGSGGAGFEEISGSCYPIVLPQSFQWYFIIFPCVPQIVPNSITFYPISFAPSSITYRGRPMGKATLITILGVSKV